MVGQTILHYKILEKLGEGGMGIVYLADDLKLERKIAVKFLPHLIAADSEEKERFKIEAKAAAALNHPNIATIYAIEDFEDDNGGKHTFIAMEYIEGIELKDKIKSGPIPVKECINIAIQIAEGLEAAHKKGIVHRDIKSSNIMMTDDGKVKIMDFGLAKFGKGEQLTKVGSTVGTIQYMSPEQARGENVDHRTDIWSFGIVLYETLTGQLPFKSEYDQAVIYSILNEEVVPPSKLNQQIPPALDNVVIKSLKKNPQYRYQNFKELSGELVNALSPDPVEQKDEQLKKIAILPFVNVSGNQQIDYLGFALADQVIGAIAYSKEVLVRPSASIRKFTNSVVNLKNVGIELKVSYVLSGNFLKINDQIRLNIELVELNTENMIWRESIKVKFNDVFELQDIVSQKVVDGLKVQFSQQEKKRIIKDIPDDPQAYEYYLKAVALPDTNEQIPLAIKMLEKSIELDPDYAPGYVELGNRYHFKSNYLLGSRKDFNKAVEYLKKAIELNGELPIALSKLGLIYVEIGEIDNSIGLFRKSLNIKPNDPETHFALSYAYRYCGALDEAKLEAEKAIALFPGNPKFRAIGSTYYYMGDYQKAREYLNYDSRSDFRNFWFGIIELQLDNYDASLENFKKINRDNENSLFTRFTNFFISYINKDKMKMADSLILLEKAGFLDTEDFFWVGVCFALNENIEGCAKWMEKAIDNGFIIYSYMISERFLDFVKNDERIIKLFEKAKSKHLAFREKFFN